MPGPAWTPELALSLRQQAAKYEAARRAPVLSPGDPLDRSTMPMPANWWYYVQLRQTTCLSLWPMVEAIRGAAHRAPDDHVAAHRAPLLPMEYITNPKKKQELMKELANFVWRNMAWEHLGGDGYDESYPKFRMNYVYKIVVEGLTPKLAKYNLRETAYCMGISSDAEKARGAPRRDWYWLTTAIGYRCIDYVSNSDVTFYLAAPRAPGDATEAAPRAPKDPLPPHGSTIIVKVCSRVLPLTLKCVNVPAARWAPSS